MSVARAQSEISSAEFVEWIAYERVSPGNPERGDLRTALLCSLVARIAGNKKYTEIQDFLLKFEEGEEEKEVTDEEQGEINKANMNLILGEMKK